MKTSKLNYVLIILFLFVNSPVSASEDMPVVPVAVLKKEQQTEVSTAGSINDSSVLIMKPGVNQIIPISIGHPNRIVTPFGSPEITSTSLKAGATPEECGEVCIKDNVIYVATNKEHPVTMFITDQGSEARALSITMIPRRVPPREVFLKLDSSIESFVSSNAKAKSWEESQPYIDAIKSVFRKIALGEVPPGYTMTKVSQKNILPTCSHPGVDVRFNEGQVLTGHYLTVYIGVAKNISNRPVEFKERFCGAWDIAAVTSWPLTLLEPGQQTEIYIAKKRSENKSSSSTHRPSLLRGQ